MFTTGSSSTNSIFSESPGLISVNVAVGVRLNRSPFTKLIVALPVTVAEATIRAELKYIFQPLAGNVVFPLLVIVMAFNDCPWLGLSFCRACQLMLKSWALKAGSVKAKQLRLTNNTSKAKSKRRIGVILIWL